MPGIRVLELYCGIGGMHWALKRTEVEFEIVAAMEINPAALETYIHNFPNDNAVNRNIQSLTCEELNGMEIDMIAMSPPCQPFCRTGLKRDTEDHRTDSFQHVLNILPKVKFRYILLENVKGFEESSAHNLLIETLKNCNFEWQEFLLTPTVVGIPNSRLRYYMIGKHQDISWSFEKTASILSTIPLWSSPLEDASVPYRNIVKSETNIWTERRKNRLLLLNSDSIDVDHIPLCVGDIIENCDPEEKSGYSLKPNVIDKYEKAMDIVNVRSVQTCCFTKSYGHYVKGTGSILNESDLSKNHSYHSCNRLRFFTPKEISRLLCYPDSFSFPSTLSFKQKSRSLGNSINVYIVSILMALLLKD